MQFTSVPDLQNWQSYCTQTHSEKDRRPFIPDVAIIIPTLNEAANIAALVDAIDHALGSIMYELIFVDDWSQDDTREAIGRQSALRPGVRVISRYGRKGLSSAVIEGALSTFAPVIVVMDADMQHDEQIIPAMIGKIQSGETDVAIGSRYCPNGSIDDWDRDRQRASRLATRIARHLLDIHVSDPMSGFFAFRRSHLEQIVPRLSQLGFKILLDILLSSDRSVKITELPYRFRNRSAGESKLSASVLIDFLLMVVNKRLERLFPPRLFLFGLVGFLGLGVHLATLYTGLHLLRLPFGAAQTLAVAVAILSNFTLNNILTFRDKKLSGGQWLKGLTSFTLICSLGAIANIGVGMFTFGQESNWWLAGLAGAIVGSAWNYLASRWLTWHDH